MMHKNDIFAAMSDVEVSAARLEAVVGITVIDESLLESAAGGVGDGYFNSVSGECLGGISCNPVYWFGGHF